jgi:hypothetical protein
MAKKKRRVNDEPEDEYEFTPTEFDEKEFILKDIYGTKVFFVVTIIAVITAAVCACFSYLGFWYVGLLLMILVVAAMKEFLKRLKFRVDMLEMKTMLGNYALYFLLTLGLWILFINPPFLNLLG